VPGSRWNPNTNADDDLLTGARIYTPPGGVEVGTLIPNIAIEEVLEAKLEQPSVVDTAIASLADFAQRRIAAMERELDPPPHSRSGSAAHPGDPWKSPTGDAAGIIDERADAEPVAAAGIAYELGELYERKLGDEALAVKAYGRALQLDPSFRANLWAIRRVFYRRQLWPNLVKLVDAEIEYARDSTERADLLLEKAKIAANHLLDPIGARAALDEARQLAPAHQGVLLELERVLVAADDGPALIEVWELLAEAADQPQRKIAYYLDVARTTPDAERSRQAFERAARAAATLPDAAVRVARERLQALEDAGSPLELSGAIEALVTALGTAAESAGQSAEIRRELVALHRRQAQLLRLESPEKSWEILQQANALAPGEALVRLDLADLAEQLGRFDVLADLVKESEAAEVDPAAALTLSVRRIDALLRGGQRDEAMALIAPLEATAPGFIALTSVAERDAIAQHDVAALAKTYLSAAQAASLGTWTGPQADPIPDPVAAAALYIQAAELLAYELGAPDDVAAARTALRRALEAVPHHPVAFEALVELEDTLGDVDEALRMLRDEAEGAAPAQRRVALERAIRIARSHGDLETVLGFERELYELTRDEIGSGVAGAAAEPGASMVPDVAWHLESTLAQLGRDDERADLLIAIAAKDDDAARRCTSLLAAARLRERCGAVEAATELYAQVVASEPDNAFARESLVDLLRAQERWVELVAHRRDEAKAMQDGPGANRALREAAWVLETQIGDLAQASLVYSDWLVRFPHERFALEGAARCRAALGDRQGAAALYATLADADRTADTQWLHAQALEAAQLVDEAADVYRSLLSVPGPSVASTAAALALGELAAVRNDARMRSDALAALADRVVDPRLKAEVAAGWGVWDAFALGDADRALAACNIASAAEDASSHANLAAVVVSARTGNRHALAQAYRELAETVTTPEVAAALWLRSASLAEAAGDAESAKRGVAFALRATSDDARVVVVAAETKTTPRIDAIDPFAAIDPLLQRAEAIDRRAGLADDPLERASWEIERAEALELAGRLREAGNVISGVLRASPDDLRAWTALRRMAIRSGDSSTHAHASYALACRLCSVETRLELFREAAPEFDGEGPSRNTSHSIATYARILECDPGAPEFDRLFELLRVRAAPKPLLRIIANRLEWLRSDAGRVQGDFLRGAAQGEDPFVPLLLERAAVLTREGDRAAAVADLDAILERSPNQIETLRFRAELAVEAGDSATAIRLWQRYVAVEVHRHRRTEIELRLAQLLVDTTDDVHAAIEQLERVVQESFDDVQAHERLFELCVRARDWSRATRELRQIVRLESSAQDKARVELRLGKLLRERVRDHSAARLALERARDLDPLNLEIVRELADVLDPAQRRSMLSATAAALRVAISNSPDRGELYQQLGQVSAWQNDSDSQWLALVGVEALGTLAEIDRSTLASGRANLREPANVQLGEVERVLLRGALGGVIVDWWRICGSAVRVATGVDASKLGFERGDRIPSRRLADAYPVVAKALVSFGIEDIDVYVSSSRLGVARALAGDPPILCLGSDIAAAATPVDRFHIGRVAATIADGVASFEDLDDFEVEWSLVSALIAVDGVVPSSLADRTRVYANAIAERAKLLRKALSRKSRAQIAEFASQRSHELVAAGVDIDPTQHSRVGSAAHPGEAGTIAAARRAVFAFGCRAGLTWCGDLAVVLEILDIGKPGRFLSDWPAVLELVAWSVSEDHLRLRETLSVAPRVRSQ
jgi:tetratricopeptide (TPR) repeat protein